MHNYTEGNSPSLRAQLGVGWNRALPAPFSFQNGVKLDGVNDYFLIPSMVGKTIGSNGGITIEFWMRDVNPIGTHLFGVRTDVNNAKSFGLRASVLAIPAGSTVPYPSGFTNGINNVTKNYFCVRLNNFNANGFEMFVNALPKVTYAMGATWTFPQTLTEFLIGLEVPTTFSQSPFDELRIYDAIIGTDEISSNYNLGFGNNPAKTEKLLAWYKFEAAELDSVLWPGGNPSGWSSGVYGIRDLSGQNNHLMPVNQSNNSTLGGNIITF